MSGAKRNLREHAEGALRRAVLSELGRDQPGTVEPYRPKGDRFWRVLFVPVYRRIPWSAKERAIGALGMTAKGWKPPAREPGEPWRPPAELAARAPDEPQGTKNT
ncbi:MAG TPA: hypothetical protein VGR11_00055 [Solirubrobacteraceae bacterium]|nr:hypothetical protein [Solirubrobacteraceae bacterium]